MNYSKPLLRVCLLILLPGSISAAESDQTQMEKTGELPQEYSVIGKWQGTWEVKAIRRRPEPAEEVTYSETFDWILDGRYLRSETSQKSDGGKSMSMFWFDLITKTYRFVIYDASGFAVELPPPAWKESTQTMEWKSGLLSPLSYTGYATFTDPNTIRWKSLWKDWKGNVIMDLEGTSIRRK